jgi:hypothetical protein
MRLKYIAAAAAVGLLFGVPTAGAAVKLVTSKDIKNGTIKTVDMSSSAKSELKGQRGPTGPMGPQGPQGAQGPTGATGASGVTSIVSSQADDIGFAFAVCPAGTRPVSGGGVEDGTGYLWVSGAARDLDTGQIGWIVAGDYDSPVTAFAYCSAGVSQFTFPDGTSARSSASASTSDGMLTVEQVEAAVKRRAAQEK